MHTKFRSIIIVVNPQSSNVSRVSVRIQELQDIFSGSRVELIETRKDPRRFAKELRTLVGRVKGQTLLGIGGGDGTVHEVCQLMMQWSSKETGHIIVLPLWGGNANDFAYMLNGLSSKNRLRNLLQIAKPVKVHPIEIQIHTNKKQEVYYAVCYVSFGASAHIAKRLEGQKPSKKHYLRKWPAIVLLKEMVSVIIGLIRAPISKIRVRGEEHEVFEQVFANGSRMAKIDRLPVTLTKKEYYHIVQSDKHPRLLINLIKMVTQQSYGKISSHPYYFETKETLLAQIDGETFEIPNSSYIRVSLAKRYLRALSIK